MNNYKLFLGAMLLSFSLLSLVPNESAEQIAANLKTEVILYDGGTTLPDGEKSVLESVLQFDSSFLKASVLNSASANTSTSATTAITSATPASSTKSKSSEKVESAIPTLEQSCAYDITTKDQTPQFDAQVISVRKKFRYNVNEEFRVKVFVKNAGNTPWFASSSPCTGPKVNLGTAREKDRISHFYSPDIKKDDNNWAAANRISMDQMRVDPGQVASFTFWAKADKNPSVYREYFEPYVENVKWLDNAEVKVDIYSGTTSETAQELQKKLLYAYRSMLVNDMDIEGERAVEVDLSEQKMLLKINDNIVREFTISSGASATPTPVGTFSIMLKNDVRIGAKPPHYVMPKFQMITPQGAGLHALPSLENDNGVFWTEAKDHLGRPVSHGCVRMAPEDADFTFVFTEVGDKVVVHY